MIARGEGEGVPTTDRPLTVGALVPGLFGGGIDRQGIPHEGIELSNRQASHDREEGSVAAEPLVLEYHAASLPLLPLIVQQVYYIAGQISQQLHCVALLVDVFDGNAFAYQLYEDGVLTDQ